MVKGEISNNRGPLICVDFDSLLLFPDKVKHQVWLDRLEKWSDPARRFSWFFSWLKFRMQPLTIRWHKLSPDAEKVIWYYHALECRITLIVRREYVGRFLWYGNLPGAIEEVLGPDFPAQNHVMVQVADVGKQALQINSYSRTHQVMRFFTSDEVLARHLPGSLVKFVYQWDDTALNT